MEYDLFRDTRTGHNNHTREKRQTGQETKPVWTGEGWEVGDRLTDCTEAESKAQVWPLVKNDEPDS